MFSYYLARVSQQWHQVGKAAHEHAKTSLVRAAVPNSDLRIANWNLRHGGVRWTCCKSCGICPGSPIDSRMPHPTIHSSQVARRRELTLDEYEQGVLAGDRVTLGRAITLVESTLPVHESLAQELLVRLLPHTGNSLRLGITGIPGAGKSTFIESLGKRLTSKGHKLAVLAVDPSSSVTGGSILGDKTRMAELSADPNAFIRPSPSAGTLGGVTRKTRETLLVCEAGGFDVVIIETVGTGNPRQSSMRWWTVFCC